MNLEKKRSVVYVLLFLMCMLPLEEVYAVESSSGQQILDQTKNIPQTLASQGEAISGEVQDDFSGIIDSQEDLIGEDIILQIGDYQPRTIRSSLLEDSGIVVHALLSGTPTNPTVTIPNIRNIVIRSQKVTTVPAGLPVSLGRVTHINPQGKELTYDNLGTVAIPIRQIPQEGKVPDEIVIDVDARIFFDVSEGLFFGPIQDILTEQSLDEWKLNKEDHSFYAGYIQATEVKDNKASFMIYDNQLNLLTKNPITLTVGQTSSSLNANRPGYISYGRLFDKYTLRLNSVKGIGDKVSLLINKEGVVQTAVLSEGEDIYQGASWYVENIVTDVQGTSVQVTVRNKTTRAAETLTARKAVIPKLEERPSSAPGANKEITDKEKEKREELKKIIEKYNAINAKKDAIKDFTSIVQEVVNAGFLIGTEGVTPALKENAISVLKVIKNYYTKKRIELEGTLNLKIGDTAKEAEITKQRDDLIQKIRALDLMLGVTGTLTKEPSPLEGSTDPVVLYRQAIAEYEKVINEYPAVTDKVTQAHWKIANLALLPGINDIQGAKNHLEILLKNYKQKDYAPLNTKTIEELLELLNTADATFQSPVKQLQDPGLDEILYVTLLGATQVPDSLKSKATITVEGFEGKEYREGEQLLQADDDELKWYVKEIRDTEVILLEEKTKKQETLTKNQLSLDVGENKKRDVRMIRTTTKKEASITIAPNTEAAFSEAIFTLHLPIEKRALDLPLFSDTLDQEIAKTEDLLAKLDQTIENVGKITEYWKKFCFITFAVVWTKNLLFGGGLAKQRTNEAFEEKYSEYRNLGADDPRNCKSLSYDECVFKNQREYDKMIDDAGSALTEVNKGNYNQGAFKDLGSEYDDSKKDLAYYKALAQKDPNNQVYRDRVYDLDARLTRAAEEKKFAATYFTKENNIKTYDELGSAAADPIIAKYQKQILAEFDVPEDKQRDNQYLWRTYSSRFLPMERDSEINTHMNAYLGNIQGGQDLGLGSITPADNQHLAQLKESYGLATVTTLGNFKHEPRVVPLTEGPQKGYAEFVSIDAFHYLQISYSSGGRPAKYDLYKRAQPNGMMGGSSDVYLGVVDQQALTQYKKEKDLKTADASLYDNIQKGQKCVAVLNKKNSGGRYSRGEVIPSNVVDCSGLGSYAIDTAASSVGPSCTEFMSPADCKLLFNACDPVICPPSRCNLGGEWQVDNVIQTGIIGSAVLCLNNFGVEPLGIGKAGGVVMPVCLSGIYAGLENLRSVIEGYRQCLITAKVSDRAVGICDRLRSYGICEILWKEGLAIFNAKNGIFRNIVNFFTGKLGSGGGEYSAFDQAVDNSVGSLKYFTQTYAKNTFALYNGGALPELGAEICKAAIFGKAPGLGNLVDQISKPESPPQFTALFDEAPYSDLGSQPLSQYKVTYHIFAGDNEDIRYTVYMQSVDPYTGAFLIQPHALKDSKGIVQNRILPRGTFASESPDIILPAGMKEICVEINGQIYGRKSQCGFGKVSTGFALNYVSDQFTQNELAKQITTAEQCVPASPPTVAGLGAGAGLLGTVSSGFIETGIVRKCSAYNPGVGGDEEKWSPVGSCGEDDRKRDLGTCWIYVPAAKNLIKETSARMDFNNTLQQTAQLVVQEAAKQGETIPGYKYLDEASIKEIEKIAENEIKKELFVSGREDYKDLLANAVITPEDGARIQYAIAESYELEALQRSRGTTTTTTPVALSITQLIPDTIDIGKGSQVVQIIGDNFEPFFGVEEINSILPPSDSLKQKFVNRSEIQIIIAQDTPIGKYNLVVFNKEGQRSNPITLTITKPELVVKDNTNCEIKGFFAPQQYWGDQEGRHFNKNDKGILLVKEKQKVTINLKSKGCNLKSLVIKIFEYDSVSSNDYVEALPSRAISEGENGTIKANWDARYVNDGLVLWGQPNELFVQVSQKEDNKVLFTGEEKLSVLKGP